MKQLNQFNILSADKPLCKPDSDRLGYASFAEHLAESLCKMSPNEGLVVAIYGPWGSGKTTFLNFVLYYLKQRNQDEQPVIVQFNPWWFSGHEDLINHFFYQLRSALKKRQLTSLADLVGFLGDLVSKLPFPYASVGEAVKQAADLLRKDVPELKEEIANELREKNKRILIVIDDIDRLTADEIRQLFRVIKAVADFPNVIYLLAFDKTVVTKALEEMQGLPGEAYLEKIVQVPFELLLPDKTALRRLLFERLDTIIAGTPDGLFDKTYWVNVYFEGIDHFIATPRDIARLTNALSVTYQKVKGEVNPVDFIAIETLRIFCSFVYDTIRKNPGLFAGHTSVHGLLSSNTADELKVFHNSWLEGVQEEDRDSVKRLLMRLFPKLEAVWNNTFYGPELASQWRKQLRICSPDKFPIYFRLAVPEGSISAFETKFILDLAKDPKAFGAKLMELANQKNLNGTTRVRVFLELLYDYAEKEIPSDCIPSVIQALFDVGDQLLRPEDEPRGLLDFGNDVRIGRVIWQLLQRLTEPERFETLREAIAKGNAIATIVREIAVLGQQHGKYGTNQREPEDETLIGKEHLRELEKLALEKIRKAAKDDFLLHVPSLPHVLYRWRDWASGEEVREWVQKISKDEDSLLVFLEKFVQIILSQSSSDVTAKMHYRLNIEELEQFLDLSQVIAKVRKLIEKSDLTEKQKIAVQQFIREHERKQQENAGLAKEETQ